MTAWWSDHCTIKIRCNLPWQVTKKLSFVVSSPEASGGNPFLCRYTRFLLAEYIRHGGLVEMTGICEFINSPFVGRRAVLQQLINKKREFRMKHKYIFILAGVALAVLLCGAPSLYSQTLGTASSYAVLGGSTVTNTATSSTLNGDLGVSPGTAYTNFPPGIVNGSIHAGDAAAATAQSDLTAAYNYYFGLPYGTDLTGQDLGGMTLLPGVYHFSSSAQLTGTLTLSGTGTFVFQMGSTLTTASNSSVILINGATASDLWWQVGTSATLGTGTDFQGNILANASITLTTSAHLYGRALARTAAVTLDNNNVTIPTLPPPNWVNVPTLSEWGLIILMVSLTVVGVLMMRRCALSQQTV